MKEIMCRETNFSNSQIKKVKPFIKNFGFEGGFIFYTVPDKNITKLKSILGKSIIKISGLFLAICLLVSSAHAGIYGNIEGGKDVNTHDIFMSYINVGYKFTVWDITSRTYGGWMTWFQYEKELIMYPFVDTYTIGQSLHFKGFYVTAEHWCSHRVISLDQKNNYKLFRHYETRPNTINLVKIGYEWEIK